MAIKENKRGGIIAGIQKVLLVIPLETFLLYFQPNASCKVEILPQSEMCCVCSQPSLLHTLCPITFPLLLRPMGTEDTPTSQ